MTETSKQFAYLQGILGQRLIAYGLRIKNPTYIGVLARGETQELDKEAKRRLEVLEQGVTKLKAVESDEVIRAYLIGLDPYLNDEAPIERLHKGDTQAFLGSIMSFHDHA